MTVYQIILKCRENSFSGDSFEVYASSDGMDERDIDEIMDRFAEIPYNINSDDKEFCPGYSFFMLNSGRYCIVSGRFIDEESKKYILHGLVLDEGIWPFYPVQIIDSSIFNYDEGFFDNDTPYLPVLDNVEIGNSITYEGISEFIKDRMEYGYDEMIAAAVKFHDSERPVVIRDTYNSVGRWIAAIQMAFPIDTAHNISFSIWDCIIKDDNVMVRGLDNSVFSVQISNEDYLIYDYARGIITRVGYQFNFLKIVKTGYLVSKATVQSFHSFLELFKYNRLDEGIDDCYQLYILSSLSGTNMDSAAIEAAFTFALNQTSEEMGEYVFNMLEPSMEKIIHAMDIKAAVRASEFTFKIALISERTGLIEKASYLFFQFLDHLTFDNKNPDYVDIFKIYCDFGEINKEKSAAFFKYSLMPERAAYITANLSKDCTPERAAFYLKVMLSSAIEIDYSWNQMIHTENMGLFLDMCVNAFLESGAGIDDILEVSLVNNEYIENMVVLFYNRITQPSVSEQFLRSLADKLEKKDEEQKLEVRKKIFEMGCGKLLYEEFVLHLLNSQEKAVFFQNYRDTVFDKIIDYGKQYYSDAVKLYIQKLPHEFMYEECSKLLNEYMDGDIALDDEGLLWAIKGFEDSQSLSEPEADIKEFISKLKNIKKSKSIITSPDILSMMDLAIWLGKGGELYSIGEILKEPIDIDKLDDKRYMNYLLWCLPMVIKHCSSPEDHKRVIRIFGREGMDLQMYELYLKSIEEILSSDEDKGFKLLVQFSVYYFYYMEPAYKILNEDELIVRVKEMLMQIFVKQSKSFISDFDNSMRQEFESRGLSLPLQWKEIYGVSTAEKGKTPIIKRITSVFKRK